MISGIICHKGSATPLVRKLLLLRTKMRSMSEEEFSVKCVSSVPEAVLGYILREVLSFYYCCFETYQY